MGEVMNGSLYAVGYLHCWIEGFAEFNLQERYLRSYPFGRLGVYSMLLSSQIDRLFPQMLPMSSMGWHQNRGDSLPPLRVQMSYSMKPMSTFSEQSRWYE